MNLKRQSNYLAEQLLLEAQRSKQNHTTLLRGLHIWMFGQLTCDMFLHADAASAQPAQLLHCELGHFRSLVMHSDGSFHIVSNAEPVLALRQPDLSIRCIRTSRELVCLVLNTRTH